MTAVRCSTSDQQRVVAGGGIDVALAQRVQRVLCLGQRGEREAAGIEARAAPGSAPARPRAASTRATRRVRYAHAPAPGIFRTASGGCRPAMRRAAARWRRAARPPRVIDNSARERLPSGMDTRQHQSVIFECFQPSHAQVHREIGRGVGARQLAPRGRGLGFQRRAPRSAAVSGSRFASASSGGASGSSAKLPAAASKSAGSAPQVLASVTRALASSCSACSRSSSASASAISAACRSVSGLRAASTQRSTSVRARCASSTCRSASCRRCWSATTSMNRAVAIAAMRRRATSVLMLAMRHVGVAQRLARGAFAAELDDAPEAQRRFGGVHAAERAAAREVLDIGADEPGWRQGLAARAGARRHPPRAVSAASAGLRSQRALRRLAPASSARRRRARAVIETMAADRRASGSCIGNTWKSPAGPRAAPLRLTTFQSGVRRGGEVHAAVGAGGCARGADAGRAAEGRRAARAGARAGTAAGRTERGQQGKVEVAEGLFHDARRRRWPCRDPRAIRRRRLHRGGERPNPRRGTDSGGSEPSIHRCTCRPPTRNATIATHNAAIKNLERWAKRNTRRIMHQSGSP